VTTLSRLYLWYASLDSPLHSCYSHWENGKVATERPYLCLPPYNSNKIPGLLLVSVRDITSSLYIPASSLSTLLITNCGLFTSQELPKYLKQLIIRVVLQLLYVFCQLTSKDPVKFDIMFAFIFVVPPKPTVMGPLWIISTSIHSKN
jgi:hypothetical protein